MLYFQAGLLTLGSSYLPRLPAWNMQWLHAEFVLDYSGGPVPDSHRVPSLSAFAEPENGHKILKKCCSVNGVFSENCAPIRKEKKKNGL